MLYLQIEQLRTNLSLGKIVEQWLGDDKKEDYTILKWLSIEKESHDEYMIRYFESFDEGSLEFADIYEFSVIDPDEPNGITHTFSSIKDVLDFSIKEYNVSLDKFVTGGMIGEEYLKYLKNGL